MKISTLRNVLTGKSSVTDLKDEIKTELERYIKLSRKSGSSIPVRVQEDSDYIFDSSALIGLCNFFIRQELDGYELSYIADAIHLSERITYKDKRIATYITEMTDPEINGPYTVNRAKKTIEEMSI